MQFALIALSPVSEISLLARAAFGVVLLLCLGIPAVSGIWSSLRTRPESDDSLDLDELWNRYKQGEISWDEYLRGKIEGARGLVGTKAEMPGTSTSDDVAS